MLAVALTTACKQRTESAGREPEPPVVAEDTVAEMSESEEPVAVEPEKKQPKESYFDRKAGGVTFAGDMPARKGSNCHPANSWR